nr:secrectory protein [Plasmodiophora brassicae]
MTSAYGTVLVVVIVQMLSRSNGKSVPMPSTTLTKTLMDEGVKLGYGALKSAATSLGWAAVGDVAQKAILTGLPDQPLLANGEGMKMITDGSGQSLLKQEEGKPQLSKALIASTLYSSVVNNLRNDFVGNVKSAFIGSASSRVAEWIAPERYKSMASMLGYYAPSFVETLMAQRKTKQQMDAFDAATTLKGFAALVDKYGKSSLHEEWLEGLRAKNEMFRFKNLFDTFRPMAKLTGADTPEYERKYTHSVLLRYHPDKRTEVLTDTEEALFTTFMHLDDKDNGQNDELRLEQ